jgi:putative transposase
MLRLYPTKKQSAALLRAAGATRWLWNQLLAEQKLRYKETQKFFDYKEMSATIPSRRSEHDWLSSTPACSLQRVAKNLYRAIVKYKKDKRNRKGKKTDEDTGFPKFKQKNAEKDSFYLTNQRVKIIDKRVFISKIDEIKYRGGDFLDGRILSATIRQEGKLWFCSIVYELEVSDNYQIDYDNAVGIDLGLKTYLTASDGTIIKNPRIGRKNALKLAKAQRQQARKQLKSKNYTKGREKVRKIHRKIRNKRRDFVHNLSRQLVNKYDVILTEDLNIKGMVRTRLAKSIHDAGWSELLRQIEYKSTHTGKNHTRIGRFEASSQLCSSCGGRQKMPLSKRVYECSCGLVIDRDLNAAINIKRIGLENIGVCRTELTPVEIAKSQLLKQEVQVAQPLLSG